ncbi:LptA/OstA family protein [Entomospira entomophila]|uniref:LPS export ABC transporter periplasmic protein LptC n=1 Tax=Entomospira entomophila TaxID=2719988 RepID=A0A968GCP0_9SPIO|nr:LptA/OstA family protein [Entomospira entomophilus]NIZ40024.1 LPS export ABC transporter periplasmic protein LptC [Entomospira entomophilus]WDI35584.1 LptA/OstA family protein [Entomospira entomophilus]
MKQQNLYLFLFFILILPLWSREEITFYAKKMEVSHGGDHLTLQGEVLLRMDSFTLYAQSVQIQGKNQRTLQAQTDVKILRNTNEAQELHAQNLHYSEISRELHAWGDVLFHDDTESITIQASSLRFHESNETWRFEGDVNLQGEDFHTQSFIAIYYEKTKQLELHGQVRLVYQEQLFEAEQILFNVETKNLTMEHIHRGTINTARTSS